MNLLTRTYNAFFDSRSFLRQVFKHGILAKRHSPADWFQFRHVINRESAMRAEPVGGPPKLSLSEIFPGIDGRSCRLRLIRPTAYNISWEEMCTISQIVEAKSPKRLFEFGTFDGRTTVHLALNSPADATVFTIDIQSGSFDFSKDEVYFDRMAVGRHIFEAAERDRIVMLTGDSTKFDFSSFIGNIDFVFIDADHSYSAVMNDSATAFRLLRPGGIVVWHDYLLVDDVTRALIDINKTRPLVNIRGTSLVVSKG